jgi:hypothetical protein
MAPRAELDDKYFALVQSALAVCCDYRPRFGKGPKRGLTVDEFRTLYGADSFYSWFGLDSPLIYAAHRAAGGMTSLYRQIGMACERLFRQVLQDQLGVSADDVRWSYSIPVQGGKNRKLTLDARIPLASVADRNKRAKLSDWLQQAAKMLKVAPKLTRVLDGPVFEVRQGYKSKDAKRQNADVSNAANAYANSYLPVVVLLSSQIDDDVAERYARAQWLILRGTLQGSPFSSTYVFVRDLIGYDLGAFFERNAARIRGEVETVTEALLR